MHCLKQVHRQKDVKFQELLERAKEGIITQEDIEILKKCKETVFTEDIIPTKLYSLNVDVDKINKDAYNKLTTEEKEYETLYKNKQSKFYGDKMKIPEKIKLRLGCQVMVSKNIDPQNNIINGTRGIILSFTEDNIVIKLMNQKNYTIGRTSVCDEYNPSIQVDYIPLQLAWAVTIHKSQGLTLDCAEMDLGSSIFQCGQAYTALSRIKDLNSVHIVKLKKSSFKVHPDVKSFYEDVKKSM
jgi:ATP-dependent DNA helicase PIF1